jgi:hypothetical protein
MSLQAHKLREVFGKAEVELKCSPAPPAGSGPEQFQKRRGVTLVCSSGYAATDTWNIRKLNNSRNLVARPACAPNITMVKMNNEVNLYGS